MTRARRILTGLMWVAAASILAAAAAGAQTVAALVAQRKKARHLLDAAGISRSHIVDAARRLTTAPGAQEE